MSLAELIRLEDMPEILTVPEVAAYLRIPRNRVYELIAQGQIPSIRFGRQIRVPRRALQEYRDGNLQK